MLRQPCFAKATQGKESYAGRAGSQNPCHGNYSGSCDFAQDDRAGNLRNLRLRPLLTGRELFEDVGGGDYGLVDVGVAVGG